MISDHKIKEDYKPDSKLKLLKRRYKNKIIFALYINILFIFFFLTVLYLRF